MSHSHFSTEQLSRYIEGELSPPEAQEVSRHLEQCGRCREQMESLRRMLATLGRLPDLAPSAGFLARLEERIASRRSLWHRLAEGLSLGFLPLPARAAALAVVLLAGVGVFWYSGRPSAPERFGEVHRIAKEQRLPAAGSPLTITAAPERGVALEQSLGELQETAAGERWFADEASDAVAPAVASRETPEAVVLAEKEARLDPPMPARDSAARLIREERKAPIPEEPLASQAGRPAAAPVIEDLNALDYLASEEQAAVTAGLGEVVLHDGEQQKLPASTAVKRKVESLSAPATPSADRKGTEVALFGWEPSGSPEAPAAQPAKEPAQARDDDAELPKVEDEATSLYFETADAGDLATPESGTLVAGYAGVAPGEIPPSDSRVEPEAVKLLVFSSQPQLTAEALEAWLRERNWFDGQAARIIEGGTTVLTARVPADAVEEATQAILAQTERFKAYFAARMPAMYGLIGTGESKQSMSRRAAGRYEASDVDWWDREERSDVSPTLGTGLSRSRRDHSEVYPGLLPPETYRQIHIHIMTE